MVGLGGVWGASLGLSEAWFGRSMRCQFVLRAWVGCTCWPLASMCFPLLFPAVSGTAWGGLSDGSGRGSVVGCWPPRLRGGLLLPSGFVLVPRGGGLAHRARVRWAMLGSELSCYIEPLAPNHLL